MLDVIYKANKLTAQPIANKSVPYGCGSTDDKHALTHLQFIF